MTYKTGRISILTIGDELLIGQTVNTNASWMAARTSALGFSIRRILTVADQKDDIFKALHLMFLDSDIILTTGGLGPTRDDITKKTLCEFFGDRLVYKDEIYQRIKKILKRFDRSPTEGHRLQAYMPAKAQLVKNKMGSAPAMIFTEGSAICISMPGVPYEMKSLMTESVLPLLADRDRELKIAFRTIMTAGEGESRIADSIRDIEDSLPVGFSISYLPDVNKVRIRVNGKGTSEEDLSLQIADISNQISLRLGPLVYGYDDYSLEKSIGELLSQKELQLATAESCTGGSIGRKITSIPGSSSYYLGGIIAYSNMVKETQLRVSSGTIEKFGAVSEETVREMVLGVCNVLHSDIGLAVTGIAGPGGGTPEKPVGTVWLGVGNRTKVKTKLLQIGKEREINIEFATNTALNLLRLFLSGL